MEEVKKEEVKQETNLEKAERLNRELDDKIAKNTELLKSIDNANAERLLAGTAGGNVPVEKKVMTPKEYTRYIEQHGRAPPNEN